MRTTTLQTAILLLLPALAGIATGYALGGRLAHLAAVPLRFLWLLWLAAAVQAAQYYLAPVREFVEQRAGLPMLAVTFGIVIVWLGLNIRRARPALRAAVLAIALGAALNATVIALNGRMPFSPNAARVAGLPPDRVSFKNEPADAHTRLGFLGDVIPLPPLRKVLSPGDILIGLGSAAALAAAMRGRVTVQPPVRSRSGMAGSSDR